MLSDEQMDRKIREHVKAHPVILPEDYQTMVQEQIRTCCEEEVQMNTSVKKQRKKRIAAAACIVLCIGLSLLLSLISITLGLTIRKTNHSRTILMIFGKKRKRNKNN